MTGGDFVQGTVAVKTLTDYHLEAFLKCPYKFYYQFIQGKRKDENKWREIVQLSVNKVVHEFYKMPLKQRNTLTALKLIQHNWNMIPLQLFEDKAHYYTILAGVTDHLLKSLTENVSSSPLFLYEKFNIFVEEINIDISLTFEVGEWEKDAFSIKKFLVEADESLVKLFTYLTILFSHKAFSMLPEKIELVSLLDGRNYVFYPTEADIPKALAYLDFLKEHIQKPQDYIKLESARECKDCMFQINCGFKDASDEPVPIQNRNRIFH